MRHAFFSSFLLLILSVAFLSACRTDPTEPAASTGSIQLRFKNKVGDQPLQLNGGTYTNSSGEPFTVTTLNYYISNIKFQKTDGSEFTVPQDSSYFLVKQSDSTSQVITLRHIPVGSYAGVTFLVGVDSVRNTMNISRRTGALDPAAGGTGMYWDWNSGYIFFKLEGTSPKAPVDATGLNAFMYHVGLFGGYQSRTLNNLKTVRIPFNARVAQVTASGAPVVQIKADVAKVFSGVKTLSIAQTPTIMISALSADVASNYAQMFQLDAIQAQ